MKNLFLIVVMFGSLAFAPVQSEAKTIPKWQYYSSIGYTVGTYGFYFVYTKLKEKPHIVSQSLLIGPAPASKPGDVPYAEVDPPDYVATTAAVLSFGGIGHAIQGRYLRTGWLFTLGSLVEEASYFYMAYTLGENQQLPKWMAYIPMAIGITVKALEVADLVFLPKNMQVASDWSLTPFNHYDVFDKKVTGLNLNYKF